MLLSAFIFYTMKLKFPFLSLTNAFNEACTMPHAMVSTLFAINLREAKSTLLLGCTKTISGIRYKVYVYKANHF